MGAVAIDINATSRKLEVLYPMNTREGIETFLEQLPYIQEAMYLTGDFDALIMIVDFEKAMVESGLSDKEKQALELVFIEDIKSVDVAKMLGVTKQTVRKWVERGSDKLANYYKELEGAENV